jgi:guanine deaminase
MKYTAEDFMKIAIAEARKGMSKGNRPFGSVIVKDGKIVAKAGHDVTAHAELSAIRKFSQKTKTGNLSGCTLYATGEPCLMCCAAIAGANISELVIAANRSDIPAGMRSKRKRSGKLTYKEIFREYGIKAKVKNGVLREEVIKLYEEFVKKQA